MYKNNVGSTLTHLYRTHRTVFLSIFLFSAVLNILALAGSFFMLLVYDEVLPGRSGATLFGLILLVSIAYLFQGFLELFRSRVMIQVGALLDRNLSNHVFDIVSQSPLRGLDGAEGMQPVRDIDQVRSYFSGIGPLALFDLPWVILYLAILFAFHYQLGLLTMLGAIILIMLTLFADRVTSARSRSLTQMSQSRYAVAEAGRRNAEVLRAMGMADRVKAQWRHASDNFLDTNTQLSDMSGGLQIISRIFRLFLQSMVLAVGAWLVINDQASGGIIIASSIISSRALAPIEQTIAQWRPLVAARQSLARLDDLQAVFPEAIARIQLPAPRQSLTLQNVTSGPPSARKVTVQDISFSLKAGQVLGVVGPSASGKSSLIRSIVGIWPLLRGEVRIDGATIDQWTPEMLGPHIGFLPQDVELFDGTVAQNIARFLPDATSEEIIAAAKKAGVHELILKLPDGYDTLLGANGSNLSAGQRQRVALARALFRAPFLVVLDEPNSNLDTEGEAALTRAIATLKSEGAIIVVVAHRPSALAEADVLLLMQDGRALAYGPKDEILPKLLPGGGKRTPAAPTQAGAQAHAQRQAEAQAGMPPSAPASSRTADGLVRAKIVGTSKTTAVTPKPSRKEADDE